MTISFAPALLTSVIFGATLVDDVARIEHALRQAGARVTRLSPHFADAQRHLRIALDEVPVAKAPCQAAVLVGPPGLVFKAEGDGDAAAFEGRSTRGVLVLASCGAPLPASLTVHVVAGRGTLETRVVGTLQRLNDEWVELDSRGPPDAAREASPTVEALPPPSPEGLEPGPGLRTLRLDADRFGRASIEDSWPAGCRRVVVRAESTKDPSDLDVVVDGQGASRWLEDKGPAAIVDRVLCTPALEPATVRISDASPGAALRIDQLRLGDFPALEHLRRPLDVVRLSAVLHAAKLAPTSRAAVVLHGTAGSMQVAVPREPGRCEGFVVTFVDGRRSPRAALVTGGGRVPFLRVGDGAGLALARCTGDEATVLIAIDAPSPWTLASVDLGIR